MNTVKGMAMELDFNNGATVPALGLGVYQRPPEQTTTSAEATLP
ncbi:hypothetical protein AB0N24_24800 [Arthrobacter sp. NPDC093128]